MWRDSQQRLSLSGCTVNSLKAPEGGSIELPSMFSSKCTTLVGVLEAVIEDPNQVHEIFVLCTFIQTTEKVQRSEVFYLFIYLFVLKFK